MTESKYCRKLYPTSKWKYNSVDWNSLSSSSLREFREEAPDDILKHLKWKLSRHLHVSDVEPKEGSSIQFAVTIPGKLVPPSQPPRHFVLGIWKTKLAGFLTQTAFRADQAEKQLHRSTRKDAALIATDHSQTQDREERHKASMDESRTMLLNKFRLEIGKNIKV